jgi:hypothetical protein
MFEAGRETAFDDICREWTSLTGFVLERTEIKKYIRKDVNNYLMIGKDGTPKRKGIFEAPSIDRKSDAPIISQALCDYFISNTSVENTIRNEKNILRFAYSISPRKEGYRMYAGSEELLPPVRWYACRNGITLEKRNERTSIKIPNAGSAKIINCLASTEVPGDINLDHYVQEAKKIINQIENAPKNHE